MDIIKLAEIGINKITTETGILTIIIIVIFFFLLNKILDKVPKISKDKSHIFLFLTIILMVLFFYSIIIEFHNSKNNDNNKSSPPSKEQKEQKEQKKEQTVKKDSEKYYYALSLIMSVYLFDSPISDLDKALEYLNSYPDSYLKVKCLKKRIKELKRVRLTAKRAKPL